MHDQRKGAGGKGLQVTKTLQLPMAFFHEGTQAIRLASTGRVSDGRRIQQHPVFGVPIGIDLSVDDSMEGNGTGREGLQSIYGGNLGPNFHFRGV